MGNWFVENALYILVICGTIFTFLWLWSFRGTLKLKAIPIAGISIVYTALDAVCVKLFAVIEYLDLSAIDRMSLFGAIFFMPFVILALAKIADVKPALLFDISTPAFLFMFMCGRINCIITGCCYGIYLTENYRWPVREAEILFYIILIVIFALRLKKGRFTGAYYAVFLLSYGVFRFAAEFVRYFPDQSGTWHRGHVCAGIAFAAGLIWYLVSRQRRLKAARAEN